MFSRCFAIPKRAKVKKHLKTRGKRWVNWAAFLGGSWGFLGELVGASALIVHQHTKTAHFRLLGAIAFPRCFNKSVLRAFLGGFFGFLWVYRAKMCIWLPCGFRGACGALCV